MLGVVLPLLVFAALSIGVIAGERPGFDRPLLRFAEREAGGDVAPVMRVVSDLGGGRALGPLALALVLGLLVLRRPLLALLMTLAALGAVLNPPLKALFAEARPDLFPARVVESGYGFPSGHAMTAMAVLGGVAALAWRTRARWPALAACALAVAAVGASRVALGVHYPSDVIAGWAFSLAWVAAWALALGRLDRPSAGVRTGSGAVHGGRPFGR